MGADKTLEKLAAWQAGNQPMPLPPSAYTEDSVAELEKRRVLSNEWICVGHVSELKEPGDYLTFDLIDTPVIVTKNRANTLRAFSNVCAHRSARLLDGSGHCSAIVCPYHSWTYNLDGELRGAPFMEAWKIEGIRLTEVRLETWEGMIFANLDSEADALAPRLASLRQRIGGFGMSDIGVVWRFD
ncbi:MAG: Rieske (2Fe-2S) protein, partial [Pseudomonadota bacterium]|nr:Rieske (2Fe-2S) protein [Pseudomonadota bacterium]